LDIDQNFWCIYFALQDFGSAEILADCRNIGGFEIAISSKRQGSKSEIVKGIVRN
jgi:hypothetical protein